MKYCVALNSVMDKLSIDAVKRPEILANAVGLAAAIKVSLPSAPVESPGIYYINTNLIQVRDLISDVNESIVFDIKLAEETSRAIWMARYNACHIPTIIPNGTVYDFFCTIFGMGKHIAEADYVYLTANKEAIISIANLILAMQKEEQ